MPGLFRLGKRPDAGPQANWTIQTIPVVGALQGELELNSRIVSLSRIGCADRLEHHEFDILQPQNQKLAVETELTKESSEGTIGPVGTARVEPRSGAVSQQMNMPDWFATPKFLVAWSVPFAAAMQDSEWRPSIVRAVASGLPARQRRSPASKVRRGRAWGRRASKRVTEARRILPAPGSPVTPR